MPQICWKGTKGGWKADWDATWYDLAALLVMLFVLILLPLTTSSFARNLNKSVNNDTGGRTTVGQIAAAAKFVSNETAVPPPPAGLVPRHGLGILIAIVGQSISGARFGWAWAEGVVAQEVDHEGNPLFDEVALSEQVYDQTIATLAIVVAMGLVFAVVMQRHLVNGVGCFAAGLFAGWVILVILFCLPIMIYAASRSLFSESAASKDCATFPQELARVRQRPVRLALLDAARGRRHLPRGRHGHHRPRRPRVPPGALQAAQQGGRQRAPRQRSSTRSCAPPGRATT